jgi:hypothetical protein
MNAELEQRYVALLVTYPVDQNASLALVKQYILSRPAQLRPDAALCLLVLYDHMIFRPYVGYIPAVGALSGLPLPPKGKNLEAFMENVRRSLDEIFAKLPIDPSSEDHRASSHQVLQAINQAWSVLSNIFAWG